MIWSLDFSQRLETVTFRHYKEVISIWTILSLILLSWGNILVFKRFQVEFHFNCRVFTIGLLVIAYYRLTFSIWTFLVSLQFLFLLKVRWILISSVKAVFFKGLVFLKFSSILFLGVVDFDCNYFEVVTGSLIVLFESSDPKVEGGSNIEPIFTFKVTWNQT